MGHRTKTCRYCYGNHSVMDCTKLQEDAKKAQASLDALRKDKSAREHIFKTLVRRFSYSYKRDTNTHVLQSIEDNAWKSYLYTFRRYLGDYEDVANEQAYKDFYSTLPAEISDAQDDVHRAEYNKLRTAGDYRHTIEKAEEARKSKQKRSNKSCSYCKGTGHTVRTCAKKKQDMEMHRNAHKIVCYYYARALSRFGFWTGSLAKTSDGSLKMFKNKNQHQWGRLFSRMMIVANSELLSEDEIDFIYLTHIADENIYFNSVGSDNERHQWGDSARFQIGTNFLGFNSIDWENNIMPVKSIEDSQNGSYPDIVEFYPTKIDTAHIYNFISQEYSEPETSTRKYEDPEILIQSAKRMRQVWTTDTDDFWHGRSLHSYRETIFNKKQREYKCWEIIHDFVEKNQHILNIINDTIVS